MDRAFWTLAVLFLMAACLRAADAPDALEKQFRELPMSARRLTGPLFWLHGDESKERLEMYVEKMAEGGNGCFTAESRPHKDWLGETWYRDLKICLDAAKKHDMKMWIFDEKWWPSGEVGGKVPPQYGCKRLVADAVAVEGGKRYEAEGFGGEQYLAAVAGKAIDDAIDGSTLIDLAPFIKAGKLAWDAPAGNWKVVKFSWKFDKARRILVDGASQDAVDWYIKTVYQPHYDRFPDDFGKSIVGYFYDEPETRGDWGTELPKMLASRGVDWKKAYVAFKLKLAGDEQAAANYQYRYSLAEAWGKTFYGGLTKWCHDHKVLSIGHFLEHKQEYLHPELCAGDMMQLMKYSDMGAIDAVFKQFAWGKRSTQDSPIWQTPKLGSSISHAYGKKDDLAMVEIYGARGQDLSYPEMKWWLDHMQVSGINFIIPHSFNPKAPYDTDCPPYFYNGGHEARWPLYRVWADYSTRLSLMLSGGKHVCPVAVLYLGQSRHAGKAIAPDQMSEVLQDALYDCDWIPYEVLTRDMTIAGRELVLREERYRILVVPPVEVIEPAALQKAKAFYDAGGIVIGYGFLPSKSTSLEVPSAQVQTLAKGLWGDAPAEGLKPTNTNAAGGKAYLLSEKPTPEQLQQAFVDAGVRPTLEVLEGKTDNWLHVLHRVKDGRDVFFVTNQNVDTSPRQYKLRIKAAGFPEAWDAMRNEIAALPHQRQGDHVTLDLALEPNESVLIVFNATQRTLPIRGNRKGTEIAIERTLLPPVKVPEIDPKANLARALEDCAWMWAAEDKVKSAAPGTRYFRTRLALAPGSVVSEARFILSADNSFTLYVNGKEAGQAQDWRSPVEFDVSKLLVPGVNILAVVAVNGPSEQGDPNTPNPAGLIGKLSVSLKGEPAALVVPINKAWKAATAEQQGWMTAGFDDAAWRDAVTIGRYGSAPWGRLGGGVTIVNIKADPFAGKFELPKEFDPAKSRVYLELGEVKPESAVRVEVNGKYAGGVIGSPLRLEIGKHLKPGANEIHLDPFAPASAKVVIE